ncbi:hypothetical protein [Nocardia sp. NBC_01009]|uniref:hypothetical protein n=1 Tax=Nocardia sp. NBC_01009 TaxID=2975996 RepID=UPI0038634B86|nr:hypothetical protein OHA42_07225 [Nocardia sp. NBC_01009]
MDNEIRFDLACGKGRDGRWRGSVMIYVSGEALWRLGLHPDQPTAQATGPRPPWWHAVADRNAGRW